MRRALCGLLAAAGAVVLALAVSGYSRSHLERYQQHLQAPGPSADMPKITEFHTHLPIVTLDAGGQEIPGEKRDGSTILGTLRVVDGGAGDNRPGDPPALESGVLLRYRGNSSLHFDKKSFRLKLVDGAGERDSHEMLGMPKEDEWILNGPFLDKTLMRNYMLMNICGQVLENTPQVRFCELFVDGEYRGVYVMMQSVSRAQAGLAKSPKNRPDTSYIVRLDRGGSVELDNFSLYTLRTQSKLNVVYPSGKTCTPEQAKYIERDVSQFEKALYSLDYDDPVLGYGGYIDVDSFVDYMVLNEFFQNYDAARYSTYLCKPLGGKLSIGPVWDFNNALYNYIETAYDATGFAFPDDLWYFMLLKDERFTQRVIDRYRQLRRTVLSEEYLLSYVDDVAAYLGPAIERNFAVWGYTFRPEYGLLEPAQRNLDSYGAALAQMKDFLRRRGDWLDQNIELLRQYSHPSAVKKFQH